MADIIKSSTLVYDTGAFKFLIIGPPGTGKTIFATTCPQPGIVFNFSQQGISYGNGDWDLLKYPLSSEGWLKFERDFREITDEIKKPTNKYKSIVLDDMTGMDNLGMERCLQMDPKRNEVGGPIWNVHYALNKNLLEGKLRQLVSLPNINVIVLCHVELVKDEKTGAILAINPMLTGKLSSIIPGYFDEVYYSLTGIENGQTVWRLQTIPVGLRIARSNLSGIQHLLPHYIPNEYPKLMEGLLKGIEANKATGQAAKLAANVKY